MSVSAKKELSFLNNFPTDGSLRLYLVQGQIIDGAGEKHPAEVNSWPVFLFLKAVGFESVLFNGDTTHALEPWQKRMAEYEQVFIQDPENLTIEECVWNEIDTITGEFRIQCFLPAQATPARESLKYQISGPPPFAAPLKVEAQTIQKFVDEISRESAQETLMRIQSILKEFKVESRQRSEKVWLPLLADITCIALESKSLEKAVQIAKENQEDFALIWTERDRALRLFASYDPKPSEIAIWASLFDDLKSDQLIEMLRAHLHDPAGAPMVKLMYARTQSDPERMIEFCLSANDEVQRLLLPWMHSHWRIRHYASLKEKFEQTISKSASEDLLKAWINGLVKAAPHQALQDFEKFFMPKRLFFNKQMPEVQRAILDALQENPGSEALAYLKKWKLNVKGVLADRIEKILSLVSDTRRGGGR